MSAFHSYPFREFPDHCYLIKTGTPEEALSIKDLNPVDYDHWLEDETGRLYWQFQHLKKSRQEILVATVSQDTCVETTTTFHPFSRLPTELRLDIFSLISGDYKRSHVHRINSRPDTPLEFISNQAISPLLHVCSESRNEYIKQTGRKFAFQSYVNFSRDLFYFMDTNSPGDFQRLAMFFNCEEASPVQRVALRQDLFQNVSHLIPECMNKLEEMSVVFEEWKGWGEHWDGGEVKFVRREERKEKKVLVHDQSDGRSTVGALILGMASRRLGNKDSSIVGRGKKIRFFVGTVEEVK